ncbi:hypothetical protein [Streptomyces kanasensis]|uniref:hypothetical protein n=1 Tax=Streptomyces kanasensis TaxID=936756 RepID=UPI003702BAA5
MDRDREEDTEAETAAAGEDAAEQAAQEMSAAVARVRRQAARVHDLLPPDDPGRDGDAPV